VASTTIAAKPTTTTISPEHIAANHFMAVFTMSVSMKKPMTCIGHKLQMVNVTAVFIFTAMMKLLVFSQRLPSQHPSNTMRELRPAIEFNPAVLTVTPHSRPDENETIASLLSR